MGLHLVDETVLVALGLGDQFLGAAVPVAGGSGVADQVAVIHLKEHRLQVWGGILTTLVSPHSPHSVANAPTLDALQHVSSCHL